MKVDLPQIHALGDVVVKPGSALPLRWLDDFELVYFPVGSRTVYETERESYVLDSPGFVLTCPGEAHRYQFDPSAPTRHLFIHFESGELRRVMTEREDGERPFPSWSASSDQGMIAALIKQILTLVHRKPEGWLRRANSLLLAVLEEFQAIVKEEGRSAQSLPVPIVRALDYIEQHLHRDLTIEEIASSSGWTHEHFTRVFVRCMGITPQKALLERRLRRAEQLLLREEWTIKRVAYEAGFADEHYFSRMFKRTRGLSATDFRKRFADPLYHHLAVIEETSSSYPLNRHFVVLESDYLG